ncbi:UNVERIFIED_CONTAM: hypothetical protein GTU68_037735 [Idotea baltica]|nr:hypothetical protein [Idotea baltica]
MTRKQPHPEIPQPVSIGKENLAIQPSTEPLAEEAKRLRKAIFEAFYAVGGGHYGGSFSVLDTVLTLYRRFLRISPDQPDHPLRDRFILSKGHAAMAYYAVLKSLGLLEAPLESYGSFGSPLEGHPEMASVPHIDYSTGSLGQGISVGLGMAVALKSTDTKVWVVLGDGECQEGQVWEAAMLAARYRVDNLICIVDNNRCQEWGWKYRPDLENTPVPNLEEKWKAFGWKVIQTDGHDFDALTATFTEASQPSGQPVLVIANTLKGKGYATMEANPERFHCTEINEQEKLQLEQQL